MPTYVSNVNETWDVWATETTKTTNTTSYIETAVPTAVWTKWQTNWQTNITSSRVIPRPRDDRTPEQRARDQLIIRNRQRSFEIRRRNATRRAQELLVAHLTAEQRAEYEDGAYFHVETANGRRRYRIERGHVGNVRIVHCEESPAARPSLRRGAKLCAHVYGEWIPEEDHMLAQKLLLESEDGETEFLQMANIS